MKFKVELEKNKEMEADFKSLAEQANGSVLLTAGGTMVLTTAVMSEKEKEGVDFFPLSVEYEERYYAAGKIKGSRFIKREGRPSDEAICNARLIDRTIRPLFNKDIKREVQVVSTVLSWDNENDPDILGINSASLALLISDIPWQGPAAAVRVIKKEGRFILNPSYQERIGADIDFIFCGVLDDDNEIIANMIEGTAEEAQEEDIVSAFEFAKDYLKKIIDFQDEIKKKIGKKKVVLEKKEKDKELEKKIKNFLEGKIESVLFQKDKIKRNQSLEKLKKSLFSFIEEQYSDEEKIKETSDILEKEIDDIVHYNVLKKNKRVDDRKLDEIREISCEVGILARAHGSGFFSRGLTKSLSILTLGSPGDQQLLEGMEIVGKKRFMHHYNFPPYSAGEIKPMRGPGRREIGHGVLAEKALLPLIPDFDDFPYTIRIVTEILSSNGSTSMASVSSSSLALMDAGVPIKKPAAGIAIGLMTDRKTGEYKLLTDIQGPEDHHGDMDFKVAGTKDGITIIQMDVKIKGITKKIFRESLEKAKKARLEILKIMEKTIKEPRDHISPYAPKIATLQIKPEKIGEVIGSGGKVINGITEKTGALIDIEDSGKIFITADTQEAVDKTLSLIKDVVREPEVGEIFEGRVKKILDFGAFVEIWPGQEGMIHISKMGKRIKKISDFLKINDKVLVKIISIDDLEKIKKEKNGSAKASY